MTTRANLSPAFTQLFGAEVHQAYQGAAVLTGAARTRTGVVGSTVNFPKDKLVFVHQVQTWCH